MAKIPSKRLQHLQVVPATLEQMPVLANLLELYVHDFTEILDVDLGDDGRFGYPNIPLYWSEPNRHPFLLRMHGKLAGFALVRKGSEVSRDKNVWDMVEFFVIRRYRRRGLGTEMAHELWRRFPGRWQVRVMQANASAHRFWQRAISQFVGKPIKSVTFTKRREMWSLFSFESKGASPDATYSQSVRTRVASFRSVPVK